MRMLPSILSLAIAACGALALSGCGREVTRTDDGAVRDHSGNWNAADVDLAGQTLSAKLVAGVWVDNFTKANNRPPRVRVGAIQQRTQDAEYINVDILKNSFESALVNSGKVRVAARKQEAPEIRDERVDGNAHSDPTTIKPDGREQKADLLVTCQINTQDDAFDGSKQKAYYVDVTVSDITTNDIMFKDRVQIKKDVSGSGVR